MTANQQGRDKVDQGRNDLIFLRSTYLLTVWQIRFNERNGAWYFKLFPDNEHYDI